MNQLKQATILALGAALVSQAAQASFYANDLYLGFNAANASSDYVIDLGQPSVLGLGTTTPVDLSGHLSLGTFNSVFTSGATGVDMGVIGGKNQFPSTYDLFATAPRAGGAGDVAYPGSNLSGYNHSADTLAFAESSISGNPAFPTAGNSAVDANKEWSANISPTFTANTFFGASGINPSSPIGSSDVLYEDLWVATPSSPYTYVGYFTLDLSGGNSSLTFSPVPEPTSLSLIAGAAALLVSRRRRFTA
jgi:hypothetical protein